MIGATFSAGVLRNSTGSRTTGHQAAGRARRRFSDDTTIMVGDHALAT